MKSLLMGISILVGFSSGALAAEQICGRLSAECMGGVPGCESPRGEITREDGGLMTVIAGSEQVNRKLIARTEKLPTQACVVGEISDDGEFITATQISSPRR